MRVLAVALFLITAFSFGLAASRYRLAAETSTAIVCGDEKLEERMRELAIGALDLGFSDHLQHAFEVWMKDQTDQPARMRRGVRQGVIAYVKTREEIEKFKLPRC